MAIAELKKRADATDMAIERLDGRVTKHDEIIAALCESLATKEDIAALRGDLRERLDRDELFDERLDHYRDRIKVLEGDDDERKTDKKHAESMRVSWVTVVLVAGEFVLGAAVAWLGWLGLHHGK